MSELSEPNNEFDVVVIGGGSAGLCAAVAASRQIGQLGHGGRVALVEKSNRLGGMGPLAYVHTFCGLYEPDTSLPPRVANRGLPAEIESAMRERTSQDGPTKMGRVYVLPQHPEIYDILAKELVDAESDRLSLMLESECSSIARGDDGVFSINVRSTDNRRTIRARSVVDCSADALVAKYLGAGRQRAELDHLQRPAFIFSLQNVGPEIKDDRFHMRLALDLVHAVRESRLPDHALGATIRHSVNEGECFVSLDLNSQQTSWNPSDPEAVKEIEDTGKSLAAELISFFKERYPCFQSVSEPQFPPAIGVRESYTWIGQHILTADELIEGESFSDAVAYASWPMEMREDAKGPKFTFFSNKGSSQIPLSSLVSDEIPGAYFAGRCISASHEALASVRVMGTCFATGQAAGMAAALYASGEKDIGQQARVIQKLLL